MAKNEENGKDPALVIDEPELPQRRAARRKVLVKRVLDDPAQQLFKPRERILFIKYFCLIFFIILGVRFWFLQVVNHDYYVKQAENNRIRDIPVPAPRGAILDREGRILVDSRPTYTIVLYQEYMANREDTLNIIVDRLAVDSREALLRQMAAPGSRSRPIVIKTNATPADRAWVEAHEYEHPEFKIELQPQRVYPHGEILAHALGYIGEISDEQLRDPEYDYCKPGDTVGQAGLERQYNKLLMGKEGSQRVLVDSHGRIIEQLEEIPPVPGQDIVTTIDFDLQKVAEEQLTATGLYGTVVVNDPRDGGILAMVSHPSFDPNLFAQGIRSKDFLKLVNDPKRPLRNRAIQDRHPPGSTWKIIMAAAGLEESAITEKQSVVCGGGISVGDRFVQCLGNHGAPDVKRAIEVSCNGFFYRTGLKLGIDKLTQWQPKFGLGIRTGIDLPNEIKGIVPSREWKRKEYPKDPKWRDADMVYASIGQSGVRPTPIQMMHSITGIGMKGKFYRPHLFKEARASKDYPQIVHQPVLRDIPLALENWETVSQGLWRVVNGAGTARRAAIEGFNVCGKTGTAQVVSVKSGATGDQKEHAWFVAYAPREAPEIGSVALIEHGGHGGVIAAPVTKAIYEAYLNKKRGILPEEIVTNTPNSNSLNTNTSATAARNRLATTHLLPASLPSRAATTPNTAITAPTIGRKSTTATVRPSTAINPPPED
jgi:penicillin-binding protein 2